MALLAWLSSSFQTINLKLILSLVFWSVVLFLLPMLFSSPAFVVQCYKDWYLSLSEKNVHNELSTMQDISDYGDDQADIQLPAAIKHIGDITGDAFIRAIIPSL
jgi:hypothetical protein